KNGVQSTIAVVVVPTLPLLTAPVSSIVNNATVSTDTTETSASNNAANVEIPINPPSLDLMVSKEEFEAAGEGGSGFADPVLIGTAVGYRITVRNQGPSDATGIVLTDILPKTGFTAPVLPTVLPEGWACRLEPAVMPEKIVCENAYFPAGEAAIFD